MDSQAYVQAKVFLDILKTYRGGKVLSKQQLSTLRGQALSGDVDGAYSGLSRILGRQGEYDTDK